MERTEIHVAAHVLQVRYYRALEVPYGNVATFDVCGGSDRTWRQHFALVLGPLVSVIVDAVTGFLVEALSRDASLGVMWRRFLRRCQLPSRGTLRVALRRPLGQRPPRQETR